MSDAQVTQVPGAPEAPATPAPVTPPASEGQPAPAPTDTKNDPVAAKFAMLTRKEQAAVRAAAEAKAAREEAARLRTEAKAIEDKWNGYKGKPEKALEALKELGFTYDQVTQLYLNGGQITPEMQAQQMQAQIDELKSQRQKDLEDARNAEINAAKAAEEQAITNFKTSIAQHLEAEKAKYPLLSSFGQAAQVWDRIETHYNQTRVLDEAGNEIKAGQVLDIPEAAKQVEDEMRAQVTKAHEILNPPQATPAPTVEAPKPAPSKLVSKPSTLTPSTTPVTASTQPKRYESDAERRARIVAKYSRK